MERNAKRIQIILTEAQRRRALELIKSHQEVGDCTLRGYTLTFEDYEGLQAFRREVFGLAMASTAAYVSMNSLVDKIDLAVRLAYVNPLDFQCEVKACGAAPGEACLDGAGDPMEGKSHASRVAKAKRSARRASTSTVR